MNCDNGEIYAMKDFYKKYFDKTILLDRQQPDQKNDMRREVYDTQGRLKDHTIIDTYAKQFMHSQKCSETPKYTPFVCPCFSNPCGNRLSTDDISRRVTDIRYAN